ncbi:vWA domain-containing protein [Phytoactinopolyspora mesophila]|nr:VWA domain-containing protein [Phytoactinopolyspora mesophila]
MSGTSLRRLGAQLIRTLPIALLATLAAGWAIPSAAVPQTDQDAEPSLLLIMDASSSMLKRDVAEGNRMDAARSALHDVVGALPDDLSVGLRVFGANEDDTDREIGCTDTELVVPVGPLDRTGLAEAIDGIEARGFTPISESLRQAADDLPATGERTIVLVSDGLDTCGPPPPCEVAKELIADGIDVTVQTVGFALDDEPEAVQDLQCIADATGGEYREADDAAELATAMTALSARAAQGYESTAQPVQGAAIHRDAPVLELGTPYADSVVQNEGRWYAYDLAEGQAFRAVEIIQLGGTRRSEGSAEIKLHNRDGTSTPHSSEYFRAGETPTVHSVSAYSNLEGPGTYYVEIVDYSLGPDDEVAYEITIHVDGEPAPQPADPTEAPTEAAEPLGEPTEEVAEVPADTETDTVAAESSDGTDVWMIVAAVLLVVVLALGIVLAVVLRRPHAQ